MKLTQKYCACHKKDDFRHVIKQVGMSQSAAPARQNDMTTCLETFEKESFCSLPQRTRRGHRKTRDSRRDTWEHQNEHFVRDFLQFSHFVASESTFSHEFSCEPQKLLLQNRCFVRGFRRPFSAHLTKCHAYHGICTLSPLDAALPMRFAKTRNTTRLKCCACHVK